jgi:hypothetical protein
MRARELMATSRPAKNAMPKNPTLRKPNPIGTPKVIKTNNNTIPIKPMMAGSNIISPL